MNVIDFNELIWQQANTLYRNMPWRDNTEPYFVLVSELMLQQTQVDRVIVKFKQFMAAFPTIGDLADAPLSDVLIVWSGLGYNRRAKFLHTAAKKVVSDFKGTIPDNYQSLVTLPGVGPNTAGAILVYSFNQPVVFIETNVRTVYFHHFFEDQTLVTDAQLRELVATTIDTEHPREWYWGIMDYGSHLKRKGVGRIDQSSHYKKQNPLKGSLREVRGMMLKKLSVRDFTDDELRSQMPPDERYVIARQALLDERLVAMTDGRLHLAR